MSILIVGNVLKDVYLGLDPETEKLEKDSRGVDWLDLGFNASRHHFFTRKSTFGGAAVTLEVLENLGISASISGTDFRFTDDSAVNVGNCPVCYRYILTADEGVSYFTASSDMKTTFVIPSRVPDYLYIDRSANLSAGEIEKIRKYAFDNPRMRLVLYLKENYEYLYKDLMGRADLVFKEVREEGAARISENANAKTLLDPAKTVYVSEKSLSFKQVFSAVEAEKIDKKTHLSIFQTMAATVLGAFTLGKTVEKSFELARINVENATINSTLTLKELNSLREPAENLELIAKTLVAPEKGILAADESGGSIARKFEAMGILDNFQNRHDYRNIFFTTDGISEYLSGVILFDETARDFMDTGETIPEYLTGLTIIPGIKVDQGLEKFDDSEETYTKGLEGLEGRLLEYYKMGLRFSKWRAAFNLTKNEGEIVTPSTHAIRENCRILASYARKCQNAGIVPIVEPELVYDGDYTIQDSAFVTSKILDCLFVALKAAGVNLSGCILKTNMVLAGKKSGQDSSPEEVGRETAKVLKEHVPAELAGVVFLSGGQKVEQATANLGAIIKNGPFPFGVTFSFARALQDPALYAWRGDNANADQARADFLENLKKNIDAIKQKEY